MAMSYLVGLIINSLKGGGQVPMGKNKKKNDVKKRGKKHDKKGRS